MKSYTDIEQSKKLAEFLPIESADMHYVRVYFEDKQSDWFVKLGRPIKSDDIIPCWSLAALLGVLPVSCDDGQHCLSLINSNPNEEIEWLCCYEDCNGNLLNECYASNPVDACYEMILKLHELKML